MQVALVTDTFPPDLNGVSLTMDRLRLGLESRGHRVNVIRLRDWDRVIHRFEELLTSASSSPNTRSVPSSFHLSAS